MKDLMNFIKGKVGKTLPYSFPYWSKEHGNPVSITITGVRISMFGYPMVQNDMNFEDGHTEKDFEMRGDIFFEDYKDYEDNV